VLSGISTGNQTLLHSVLENSIVEPARQIGTFEISTEPYEDRCSLFVPKHPVTRAIPEIVYEAEEKIKVKTNLYHSLI
jgi:thiamine biosynthesis protein ThiI